MPTRHRELERKLDAPAELPVPQLDGLVDGARLDAPVAQELSATYFDTAEGALGAAGISLRRRTGGDDAGWHLKVPADGGARDELRLPLGRATKSVPAALRDAAHLYARGAALLPVAEIRTRRTVHRLRAADDRVLVEIADDAVVAQALPAGAPVAWREWEVEVVDGAPEHLDAVVAALTDAGATAARSSSKVARVLGRGRAAADEHGEPAPELLPESPARAVVHAALRARVAELRLEDPLVRADLDGAVHRMRVATRRLRSITATFRPLLEREATDPLRAELRWIAGVLGGARDAEVLRGRLAALVARQPVELMMGAVAERIDDELRARRRAALAAALDAMRSERYLALMDGLERLATQPPWTDDASATADAVLRDPVRRAHRRLRRRVRAAAAADAGERDALLHEARKAAKRLRYAAEVLAPAYGKPAERTARAAQRIQSVLGDQHDTVVARALLRELGVQAHLDGDNAFGYGVLHAREQADATAFEHAFERAWSKASRPRLRRWLD
ncbi:MAG: CHAD domain-containing protein [Actinomycetota bacterium]